MTLCADSLLSILITKWLESNQFARKFVVFPKFRPFLGTAGPTKNTTQAPLHLTGAHGARVVPFVKFRWLSNHQLYLCALFTMERAFLKSIDKVRRFGGPE